VNLLRLLGVSGKRVKRPLELREMEDFLGFFIVLKVETSKNFLKVVGRVMHKLVK